MRTLTVVIADDHAHETRGFNDLLEFADGIKVVGLAHSAQQAVRQAMDKRPDVILLDLVWIKNKDEGIMAIYQIRQAAPETRILAMTNYDEDMIKPALEAGADKAVSKNDLGTIEALTIQIQAAYDARTLPRVNPRPFEGLSDREMEALLLMCEGMQDKEIAQAMVISTHTVKRHVENIYNKLGTRNRGETIAYAIRNGLSSRRKEDGDK